MPADLVTRIDLDLLYPDFLERALHMLARCRARGADYFGSMGFRSWGEQHQLRQKFLNGTGGRAAPAGYSAHNYGLAIDFARDGDTTRKGLQPVWGDKDYDILGEEAARLGLHWGAGYNDRPHISWPGYVTAKDLEPLRLLWVKAPAGATQVDRLSDCWEYVGRHSPGMPSI